jgi:hypothetical protein
MEDHPAADGGGEGSGVGSNNYIPPSYPVYESVEDGYYKQEQRWNDEKAAAEAERRRKIDEAQKTAAADAEQKFLDSQTKPKFTAGDIVKIQISEKSKEEYNDTLFGLKKRIPPNKIWLDFAFDGAIGEVVSMFSNLDKYTRNPTYKYIVNVYRLSGTSKYNPDLQNNKAEPPTREVILERDMEKVELTEEALNIEKNAWKTVKFEYSSTNKSANWTAGGGKRRSKSAKRVKTVKTAKRSKSRRTRRQRK